MGKTKLTVMDDSLPQEEGKKPSKKVEKKVTEAKLDEESRLSEAGGTSSESTSPDVHEPGEAGAEQSKAAELETQAQASEGSDKATDEQSKKKQKIGKAKPRSKKYQEISKDLDKSKYYPLAEAVELLKKLSYTKFDATIEAHINTVQTGLRGFISMPFAAGKKIRILAFGKDAQSSGADLVGSDEAIEDINKGKINFDLLITTPEWMPKLAKVARILGPRSLMPNPKSGTITEDLKKAVESFQAGKTEYKTEAKAPIIHMSLGKLNQPSEELSANIKTFVTNLGKTKIKKVTLSPTMGPAVKLDLASV